MEPAGTFNASLIVTLDIEAMAGRIGYKSGVRPNHRISGRFTDTFIGALYFKDRDLLKPGESTEANSIFIVYTKGRAEVRAGVSMGNLRG